jgi:hypothetical protein
MKEFLFKLKYWKPLKWCKFFLKHGWKIPKYLIGHPATEDLTTYTEVDPNARITVTAARSSFVGLTRNEDAYVYYDKGVNHFNGDFEHLLDVYLDSADAYGIAVVWALTNLVDDWKGIIDAAGDALTFQLYFDATNYNFILRETDAGVLSGDTYVGAIDTPYYLKIVRDESVGTYGTLYAYIYSDAARTTLLDTLSVTLNTSKKDFRYVYVTQTYNDARTETITGYVENLDLQEAVVYTVSKIEPLSLAEVFSKSYKTSKSISEAIILSEVFSKIKKATKSISETIVLAESKIINIIVHNTISETITLSETFSKIKRVIKSISETIALAESISISTIVKNIINVVETIVLTETVSIAAKFKLAFSETISLAENIVKKVIFIISKAESIVLSEIISISGRIWAFLTKSSAPTWGYKSKSTSPTWTEKSKSSTPSWSWRIKRR